MLRTLRQYIWNTLRKCDIILLLLCLVTTAYGILVISSATNYMGETGYAQRQMFAALLGVMLFFFLSSIDATVYAEHRVLLIIIMYALLLILIPFGRDNGSGNKSWIRLSFLDMNMQPAEFCKILFVVVIASVMATHQNKPSSPLSVMHGLIHMALVFFVNWYISDDLGVSLIFAFAYLIMVITGGVSWFWLLFGAGVLALVVPIGWNMLASYQKSRFLILFDPTIDPNGLNERYHTIRSLRSLTGGGLTGQGLFQGNRTQSAGSLPAQHTDYIFSAIGEELGYLGCAFTILLLCLIIWRIIWVGTKSPDYMRRMICFGSAGVLIFQVLINVGMCIGVMPVIGLTLPFISYGGSSILSIFMMMGLVSGVYAHPTPTSYERYIRPPYMGRTLG